MGGPGEGRGDGSLEDVARRDNISQNLRSKMAATAGRLVGENRRRCEPWEAYKDNRMTPGDCRRRRVDV